MVRGGLEGGNVRRGTQSNQIMAAGSELRGGKERSELTELVAQAVALNFASLVGPELLSPKLTRETHPLYVAPAATAVPRTFGCGTARRWDAPGTRHEPDSES